MLALRDLSSYISSYNSTNLVSGFASLTGRARRSRKTLLTEEKKSLTLFIEAGEQKTVDFKLQNKHHF